MPKAERKTYLRHSRSNRVEDRIELLLVDVIFYVETNEDKSEGAQQLCKENLAVRWQAQGVVDDLRVEWILARHVVRSGSTAFHW